jgi:outer membrane murein-binding lipoprotein Lpp
MDTATMALGVSLLVLVIQVLNTIFGRSDKGSARIDKIADKQHTLELQMKTMAAEVKDHTADHYATKDDVARLEKAVFRVEETISARMKEYTDAVTAVLGPIAEQLTVKAVRKV